MGTQVSEAAQALTKAVSSIPSYVERSAVLVVLAPPCVHKDTGRVCNLQSWRMRGWCRLEFVAARLAASEVRVMIV